jgi:hypothetical protein
MQPQSRLFRRIGPPNEQRPRVIETSGVEVIDVVQDTLSVAPANLNGASAPAAECAVALKRPIPFASTLRHIG